MLRATSRSHLASVVPQCLSILLAGVEELPQHQRQASGLRQPASKSLELGAPPPQLYLKFTRKIMLIDIEEEII